MADDVSAGRLVVDVVGDTTGFARGLQERIDAEVRRVKARIGVEIDQRAAAAQAKAAARVAEKAAGPIRVKAEVDAKALIASALAAVELAEEALRSRPLRVPVEIDNSALRNALGGPGGSGGGKATVTVDADTRPAEQAIERVRRSRPTVEVDVDAEGGAARAMTRLERLRDRIRIPVDVDVNLPKIGSVSKNLLGLLKIPAILTAIGSAAGALTSVVGGLFAITSAAGQAAGALAAIPAGIGLLAQTIGTVIGGFRGIGDAVKATKAAQQGQGAAAAQSAAQQQAAARRIADAERNVADARRRAGEAAEASAERIREAQRRVGEAQERVAETARRGAEAVAQANARIGQASDAATAAIARAEERVVASQENALRAQKALTQARRDAKEVLEDLALSLKAAALDEEAAGLAVERARAALDKANRDPRSTDLDRREADLAYRQAQQSLEEIKERNADLRDEAAKTNKAGVEGSDRVKDAQERLDDATKGVTDSIKERDQVAADGVARVAEAERDAAEATRDAARANADAAEQLQESQRDVAQARRDAGRSAADSARAIADAERNLLEARQAATEQAGRETAAMTKLNTALANLGPNGQAFVTFLSTQMGPALKAMRQEFQERFLPYVQRGLTAFLRLMPTLQTGLNGSADAVGGLIEKVLTLISTPLFAADLGRIMASNNRVITGLTPGIESLVSALRHLVVATGPFMERVAGGFSRMTKRLDEFLRKQREIGEADPTKGIAGYMDRAYRATVLVFRVLGHLGQVLGGIGRAAAPSGERLLVMFDKWLVRIRDLNRTAAGQNKLRAFFESTEPVMVSTARLLAAIGRGLVDLAMNPDLPKMIDQLTAMMPTVTDVFNDLISDAGPGLLTLIDSLLRLFDAIDGGGDALRGAAFVFNALAVAIEFVGKVIETLVVDPLGWLADKIGSVLTLIPGMETLGGVIAALVKPLTDLFGLGDGDEFNWLDPLLTLAGMGAALGLIVSVVARLYNNIKKLGKIKDVFGSRGGGGLAGGVDAMSDAIDDELPKDKAKTGALDDVAGSAGKADDKARKTSGTVVDLGDKMDKSAKKTGRLSRALSRIPGLGRLAGPAAAAVGTAGATAAGAAGAGAAAGARGVAGRAAGALGRGARAVGPGAVLAVGGTLAGEAIQDGNGGARDVGGGALSGAASGAGLGAMIGSVIPGLGTAIGAAIGGAIGGIVGAVNAVGFDKVKDKARDAAGAIGGFFKDAGGGIKDAWNGANDWLGEFDRKVTSKAKDVAGQVAGAFAGIGDRIGSGFRSAKAWGSEQWASLSRNAGEAKDTVVRKTGELRDGVRTRLVDAGVKAATAAATLRDNVSRRFTETRDNVQRRIGEARDGINSRLGVARDWASKRAQETRDNLSRRFGEARDNMQRRIGEARDGVNSRLATARDWANTRATETRERLTARFNEARNNMNTKMAEAREYVGGVHGRLAELREKAAARAGEARDRIGSAFDGIKSKLAAPIKWAVTHVFNGGLVKAWNSVATRVNENLRIPNITLGFAKGGTVPGYAPGRDRVAAMLSPGEGILVPEAVRGIARSMGTTATNAIQAINSRYSGRVSSPGTGYFATGGVAGKVKGVATSAKRKVGSAAQGLASGVSGVAGQAKDVLTGAAGAAREGIANVAGGVQDVVLGGLRKGFNALLAPIKGLLGRLDQQGAIGRLAAATVRRLGTEVSGFLGKKDKEAGDSGGGTFAKGGGSYPPARMGVVSANTAAAARFVQETWGVNSGLLGSRPNKSDHPMGKALDAMVGLSDPGRTKGNSIAKWFAENAREFGTKYVIWYKKITTGNGWRPYSHPTGQSNPTLDHMDHVHVSFLGEGGTVLPRKGGTLAVLAEQGRAETVVDTGSMNSLIERVLAGDLGGSTSTGGPGVVFQEGSIVIHNPAPEPASESVSARMRRLSEFGLV